MVAPPQGLAPILAAPLLPLVEDQLHVLISGLDREAWEQPTIVPGWRVKDVAAHLLDTSLRKLAVVRDGYAVDRPRSGSPEDVRAFVDRVNAEGVAVYGRLSPAVVHALMRQASHEYCAFHLGLDPFAPAAFAVSWAGETESANWFDTARELTERWHHQQQIRLALDRPGIMTRELYHPVLDCFMRALPYAYREVAAAPGVHILIRVAGPCGGDWVLYRTADGWMLAAAAPGAPVATVTIPEAIAWRLFTKGIARAEAEALARLDGDRGLGRHALNAVAIVG
jgi:uncharacterized protein (TIGR03083 family)